MNKKLPGKIKVTRSGAKLVSMTERLMKITDPKILMRELRKLTDEQYELYKKEREKLRPKGPRECVYASSSMNYISRWHRAYLWMFRLIPSVDIDNKTGTVTIVWTKYAFGHVFVMGEEIRKFEEAGTQSDFMTNNYINALFGTPDERKEAREIFFNKKREETMKVNVEIAKICHEANRQHCIDNQLITNPVWDELEPGMQESIVSGVAEVIADPKTTPAEMHQKWCDYKEEQGWKYALNFDAKLKTHPNLVPFNKLTKAEQAKDELFIKTVKAEMKK